jgi:hypothetical protein
MNVLHTEIDIEASAATVWAVLTRFADYPAWNPIVRRISGAAREGERLVVEVETPGGRFRRVRPRIVRLVPGEELRWLERLAIPGVLDGERAFRIESFRPERVRFFQRQVVRGLLAGTLRGARRDAVERDFARMNAALKRRAEASARP